MKRAFVSTLFILLSWIFVAGCNNIPNCSTGSNNELKVRFRSLSFDTDTDSFVIADTLLPILQVTSGARPDSLFFDLPDTLSTLVLPVDPSSDNTRFVLNISGQEYFIDAAYERSVRLIAPECGIEQLYSNLDVQSDLPGDSLVVLQDELLRTSSGNENINVEIYF